MQNYTPEQIDIMYVDLFCGAGGTSTGIHKARVNGKECAKVIACVNHDANAIASHEANHPDTLHFTEDIRTLDLTELIEHVRKMRKKYPNAKLVLWSSLECTNFSNAKGGPRDADSRTLAEHLFRYIHALNPDAVHIENVREFKEWGPLDSKGKPIKKHKGMYFERWNKKVKSYGYRMESKLLNSADYGAYTARKRLFIQYAKKDMPIAWPDTTFSKDNWKPVKEVLDLSNEGINIFDRHLHGKKPLAEKTLKRILEGLVKFHKDETFLYSYYGNGNTYSKECPCPTVTTKDRFGKIAVKFFDMQYGNGKARSLERPAPTVTNIPKMNLVSATRWILNPQYTSKGGSIDDPCFTLIARMDKMPPYLMTALKGISNIEIRPYDSEYTRKIKQFMIENGITEVKQRMLEIEELLQIMGFPANYVLIGSIADQKKFIGNAVEVNQSKVICEAVAKQLTSYNLKLAA